VAEMRQGREGLGSFSRAERIFSGGSRKKPEQSAARSGPPGRPKKQNERKGSN